MSCSHPKIINRRLVPCGKCLSCRKRYINDWSVRMELERRKNNMSSLFITLTYDDDHLPKGGLLNKRDLQLFFKRLRRHIEYYKLNYRIKYFASGEYGKRGTIRPHYHICLFGLPLGKGVKDFIAKSWKNGFVDVKVMTYNNCRYVAKYCIKNMQNEKINSETGEVSKEFVTMSRRSGGIGFGFFRDCDVPHLFKERTIKINGYSFSIPKSIIDNLKKKLGDKIGFYLFPRLVIFYNDKRFLDAHDFHFKCPSLYDKIISDDLLLRKLFRHNNIETRPLSEYFARLESFNQKEQEFFKGHKERYYDFYKNFYRTFDTLEDFKCFVYANFSCLFY